MIFYVKIIVIIMEFVKTEDVFVKLINFKEILVRLRFVRIIAVEMESVKKMENVIVN